MDKYQYQIFRIPKKAGGYRVIFAPTQELKSRQRHILKKLYEKLEPPYFCKGFVKGLSIYDNAKIHRSKKYVLNVDIKDFFTSCKKSSLPSKVKKVLTEEEIDLLFYKDFLPQGAPTSPYVSNFYLEDADATVYCLLRLQISDDIVYTRYADDITVSSNSKAIFSKACLNIIEKVLNRYGFQLNKEKIRFMHPGKRKEVTGLCINSGQPTVSRKFRQIVKAAVHNYATKGVGDYNKVKGWLAFLAGIPAHSKWAKEQLLKLNQGVLRCLYSTR